MRRIFRHSAWDSLLALFVPLQLTGTILWALTFAKLPLAANVALIFAAAGVFYLNPIVITHNFIHTPFFASARINKLLSLVNSVNLGLPQILYHAHHQNHHRYGNDAPRAPGRRNTRDWSSTYRFGRDGEQEGVLSYSALALLRDATSFAWREVRQRGDRGRLYREVTAAAAGWLTWLALDWRFAVLAQLPVFYFGWFLAHMENYYEHHLAAAPGDAAANSVSYYGKIYNLLMCNEGYHQEHHIKPSLHWTQRPRLARSHIRPDAYVAHVPPLLGFLERPLTDALPTPPALERPRCSGDA